ncbi:hypothetical protein AOB60_29265 [Streptomyces noursei]|uniref:Uncharacterized protein n=1 Tax=Streptomyces noursei TaxID=1971 RepID=A0A2N8PAX4_STRNR|nr:hypothetical protein AOB60_29265 [Streptomyces noursei]
MRAEGDGQPPADTEQVGVIEPVAVVLDTVLVERVDPRPLEPVAQMRVGDVPESVAFQHRVLDVPHCLSTGSWPQDVWSGLRCSV